MFFKSRRKDAKIVANDCLVLLKKCFLGPGDHKDAELKVPNGFFDDPYIFGYFHSFVSTTLFYVLGGENWSKDKKGEFAIIAFNTIDPSETLSRNNINMIADKSYKEKLDKDKNFYNGQQDAITFVLLSNKLLKPDDPDPKLAEAKKLLPQVEELNMSLGIFTEEELQVDQLPVAVLLVTIIDYISANWKNTS